MKKNRALFILITLASYFFFVFVINVLGVINDLNGRESKIINERKNEIFLKIESIFSGTMKIRLNCGLDPTPNPSLPPKIEHDNEPELMD